MTNGWKSIAAAVTLAAGLTGAGQASAQLLIPSSDVNNTGGSDLVFTLFSDLTSESYSLDLGIHFNDGFNIANGTSYDLTLDPLFNGVFAQDHANLRWGVVAADSVFTGSDVYAEPPESVWGMRMLTTSTNPISGISHPDNKDLRDAVGTTFFNNVAVAGTHPTQPNGSSLITSGFGGWDTGSNMESWGGNVGFNTDGAVGQTLFFTGLVQDAVFVPSILPGIIPDSVDVPNALPALLQELGSWLLTTDGQLIYTAAVSEVPVPAAVWLFGSALVGLVGVSRRRSA